MVIHLRGMTWDHQRGIAPLLTCSSLYQTKCPGVSLEWQARPLESFEETPVSSLALGYDIVAIDHPFIGQAATTNDFLPLDDYLSPRSVAVIENDSLGPSGASYRYAGRLWAVPVDAAAQSSVIRPDIVDRPPQSWDDAHELIRQLPRGAAAIPANPTHLWSSLLSFYRQFGGPSKGPEFWPDNGLDEERLATAVERLSNLLALLHPESYQLDPIQLLDQMASDHRIRYVPLVFGYINYAQHDLTFISPPRGDAAGTLLGGVGLALSAHSDQPAEAAQFLAWVASSTVQAGSYAASGGQPAHLKAWRDPRLDSASFGFYSAMTESIENAFVRSRHPSYPQMQRHIAQLLHQQLRSGESISSIVAQLSAVLCRPLDEQKDKHDN